MRSKPDRRERVALLAARLLASSAFGTTICFLLGGLGDRSWMLDGLSHWRVQYAVVLTASLFGLTVLRRWRSALLTLPFAAYTSTTAIGCAGWSKPAAEPTARAFRFVTFNQHVGNRHALAIGNWLEQSHADVVVLQELSSPLAANALAALLPSYPHYQVGYGPWADAAIFSRWPILSAQFVKLAPGAAQAAKVRVNWLGEAVTVVGVHLHWGLGPESFQLRNAALLVLADVPRSTSEPLLVGGDLNITQWSPVFRSAIGASQLTDCARGHGLISSWPTFLPPAAIRIDHCLVSGHWRTLRLTAGPSLGSDHRPIVAELEIKR